LITSGNCPLPPAIRELVFENRLAAGGRGRQGEGRSKYVASWNRLTLLMASEVKINGSYSNGGTTNLPLQPSVQTKSDQ
jgi:hypothetical protein